MSASPFTVFLVVYRAWARVKAFSSRGVKCEYRFYFYFGEGRHEGARGGLTPCVSARDVVELAPRCDETRSCPRSTETGAATHAAKSRIITESIHNRPASAVRDHSRPRPRVSTLSGPLF